MRKINNNYLGDFYIEKLENREEQDKDTRCLIQATRPWRN